MDEGRVQALELARGLSPTAANLTKVARKVGHDLARWAFTQWELRQKARAKFARADEMLFDRDGLEMASHERIASYAATLFPRDAHVVDLTTGIGAHTIALASRGPASGYDLNPERLDYAAHNLRTHELLADLTVGDSLAHPIGAEYALADPARRSAGSRTLNPDDFAPPLGPLIERMRPLQRGVIKLSPMLPDSLLEGVGSDLRFLSFERECREALVSLGTEANEGRCAVHIASGEVLPAGGDLDSYADDPDAYFFEADPAAIRAHCLGTLAQMHRLSGVGDSNGYLTGAAPVDSVWLRCYRVLHHGKGDLKETRAKLRELGSGTPEVKQRGAGLDLVKIRKQLTMTGERVLYLAVWPVGKSLRHTILEPLEIPGKFT